MARLTMRRGPDIGIVYELTSDSLTIGRGAKNDIVVQDPEVSRIHCQLVRVQGGYEVHDLNSQSGTFVNGRRVQGAQALPAGALIELGDMVTLEYEGDSFTQGRDQKELPLVPPFILTPDDQFYLVLNAGRDDERVYPLQADQVTVGRDLSNDIVVQDPEVSRWHVRLARATSGYTVEDTGSTNGTMINGQRLSGVQPLRIDDTIELAPNSRLRYVREVTTSLPPISVEAQPPAAPKTTALLTNRETQDALRTEFMAVQGKWHTTQLGTGMARGALVNHIFLAYAREDWEGMVAPLMVTLQDAGISVCVEQYLMQGGDDWRAAVEQALSECWLMVLVLSPEALESRFVKWQYRYFINREKPLVPLGYRAVGKLPPEFSGLEVMRYDDNDPKRSTQRLIYEILQKRR